MTATIAELATVVSCSRCGARPGVSCAAAMLGAATKSGDETAIRELRAIVLGAPPLAHPERLQATEDLIDSAEAYGLVRRVKGERA